MRLLVLENFRRTVVAPAEGPGSDPACAVLRFLREQPSEREGSAKGFKALFRRYGQYGRNGMTTAQFHLANQEEEIWEFRKGRLRVFCFEDGKNHLVILTHGAVKKTQKASKAEIKAAVAIKNRYVAAVNNDDIKYLERPDDTEPGY